MATKKTKDTSKATDASSYKYVGPEYRYGITIPEIGTILPAQWSQERIAEMTKKHPRLLKYFSK